MKHPGAHFLSDVSLLLKVEIVVLFYFISIITIAIVVDTI